MNMDLRQNKLPRYQRMDPCGIMVQAIHKYAVRRQKRMKAKEEIILRAINFDLCNSLGFYSTDGRIRGIWQVNQAIKKPIQRIKDLIIGFDKTTWQSTDSVARTHSKGSL